jgi:hypothetical protein
MISWSYLRSEFSTTRQQMNGNWLTSHNGFQTLTTRIRPFVKVSLRSNFPFEPGPTDRTGLPDSGIFKALEFLSSWSVWRLDHEVGSAHFYFIISLFIFISSGDLPGRTTPKLTNANGTNITTSKIHLNPTTLVHFTFTGALKQFSEPWPIGLFLSQTRLCTPRSERPWAETFSMTALTRQPSWFAFCWLLTSLTPPWLILHTPNWVSEW